MAEDKKTPKTKKKKEKLYSSEELSSIFEESRKKWKAEWDLVPAHGFKKGDWLWEFHPKHKMWSQVKVVDCAEKILLVKNIEYWGWRYRSIPYRVEPENFKNLRKMTPAEIKKEWRGRILGRSASLLEKLVFKIYDKVGLKDHTRSPKTLRDYACNWMAFFVTVACRIQSWAYDPSPNTFKGLNAHGPLWKGQKVAGFEAQEVNI